MKQILFTIFLFYTNIFFAQDLVKSLNLTTPNNSSVFQIIEKDKINLFFNGSEKLKIVQLDSTFNLIDSLTVPSFEKKYKKIIGHSKTDENYYIYWSNNNEEILAQSINLKTKKSESIEFKINLKKEKVLCQTTINDKFYTITINNNSNILNFIEISNNQVKKNSCDMSSYNFGDNDNELKLYSIFITRYGNQNGLSLETIKNEIPTSLVNSSKKKKLYILDDKVRITLDYYFDFTDIITIDLNNFNFKIDRVNTPDIKNASESTSFMTNNYLIQSKLNSKKIIIDIKDLNYKLVKSLTINDNEDISFKNSDIIQEAGRIKNTRILDKSNQLIRKIDNNYFSISCFEKNDKILMTIGGVSTSQNKSSMIILGGVIGGFSGAIIAATLVGNLSINNINSYADRKVIYINCLFDNKFNHSQGELQKTAFDKMRLFSENNLIYESRTVFNLNKAIYFCGKIGKNNYDIIKFVND